MIGDDNELNMVDVKIQSFCELVGEKDKGKKLAIPEYQRNYVWGKDKVEAFIEDIREHRGNGEIKAYYMGSILLYAGSEKNHYEIIDGQQRITTLSILSL